MFVRLPRQQDPAARPVGKLTQSLQTVHSRHGVIENADPAQVKSPGLCGPVLKYLRNQRAARAPTLNDLLLGPGVGLPFRGLLLHLVDAGLRPQVQPDVPVVRQDHGQHFEVSRVIVQKNNGTGSAKQGKAHGLFFAFSC